MALDVVVARGSLTDGDERVLVNASNTSLDLGTGVSAAISRACGPQFQESIHRQLRERRGGPLLPGEVLVTDAGTNPRARWVAHVAVMDYRGGGSPAPTLDTIRTGCERLWEEVERIPDEAPPTVAMVALGAGVGGLALGDSVRIACETLKAHLAIHAGARLARVVFYGYSAPEYLATAEQVLRHFPQARRSG